VCKPCSKNVSAISFNTLQDEGNQHSMVTLEIARGGIGPGRLTPRLKCGSSTSLRCETGKSQASWFLIWAVRSANAARRLCGVRPTRRRTACVLPHTIQRIDAVLGKVARRASSRRRAEISSPIPDLSLLPPEVNRAEAPCQGTGWEAPCPADTPFEGRKPTLAGLVAVTTVSTIIYGPWSRLRLAHFSRQSSKTRYYSRRGTPSPTTKVQLTHWPVCSQNLGL